MLERTLHRYQNRTVETAQVIEELIELAPRDARGKTLVVKSSDYQRRNSPSTMPWRPMTAPSRCSVMIPSAPLLAKLVKTIRPQCPPSDWTLAGENVRGTAAGAGQAHPAQVWLSARQTGAGDSNGTRTGGDVVSGLGQVDCYGLRNRPVRLGRAVAGNSAGALGPGRWATQ